MDYTKTEYMSFYYDGSMEFPITCKCGGKIELFKWGFDSGYDSATFYKLKCNACNRESEDFMPNYFYDLFDILKEIFF